MAPTLLPGGPWGASRLRHRFLIDFRLHFGSHFETNTDQHRSRILKKKRASVLNALFGHLEASGPCFRVEFGSKLGVLFVFFLHPRGDHEKDSFLDLKNKKVQQKHRTYDVCLSTVSLHFAFLVAAPLRERTLKNHQHPLFFYGVIGVGAIWHAQQTKAIQQKSKRQKT